MAEDTDATLNDGGASEIVDNAEEGRFEIRVGDRLGFADYHLKKDVIVFTHTR